MYEQSAACTQARLQSCSAGNDSTGSALRRGCACSLQRCPGQCSKELSVPGVSRFCAAWINAKQHTSVLMDVPLTIAVGTGLWFVVPWFPGPGSSWFLGSKILDRLGSLVPDSGSRRPWFLVLWFHNPGSSWFCDSMLMDCLGSLVPQSWIVLVLWFHNCRRTTDRCRLQIGRQEGTVVPWPCPKAKFDAPGFWFVLFFSLGEHHRAAQPPQHVYIYQ